MGISRTTARFMLATLFLTAACGGATPPAIPTSPPAGQAAPPNPAANSSPAAIAGQTSDDMGVNLLIVAEGTVALKRQSWADYFSTEFGSELRRGDLIRISGGGEAIVLCDGLTTWTVSPGAPAGLNNGCPPPPESVLVRGESLVGNTRGAVDPRIPYVISPRKTRLLAPTPLLRWNPVEGATSYTVSIRGNGVDWSTTTGDTELYYPGVPALIPGESYALIVETDSGATSRDERRARAGFHPCQYSVRRQNPIRGRPDCEPRLDARSRSACPHPALCRSGAAFGSDRIFGKSGRPRYSVRHRLPPLGDLYRQTGLNELAGEHYQTAIAKAQAADNVETQAAAQEGLAEVMIALGDEKGALALLEAATTGYQTLGDTVRVAAIQARIDMFTQ